MLLSVRAFGTPRLALSTLVCLYVQLSRLSSTYTPLVDLMTGPAHVRERE